MRPRVVLASQSRARGDLLLGAGVAFQATPPHLDEAAVKTTLLGEGLDPLAVAEALAERKAKSVAAPGALVIGADQTLDLDGRLFDKPADLDEAAEHLWELRGREHRLHSAVCLVREGEVVWREVRTARLWMREFSNVFLSDYLMNEGSTLLWSVGGYRLEGEGVQLFERIEGDYFTILGLPLLGLLEALRGEGALTT